MRVQVKDERKVHGGVPEALYVKKMSVMTIVGGMKTAPTPLAMSFMFEITIMPPLPR